MADRRHDLVELEAYETALELKEGEALVYPEDQEALICLVLSHVRETYDPDVELDVDGEIRLERAGVSAWVRISDVAPVISLVTPVAPRPRRVAAGDDSRLNPQILDEFIDDFFTRYADNASDLADRLCATTELEFS